MTIAELFAALGLLICVLLAIEMALPQRRQQTLRHWLTRPRGGLRQALRERFGSRARRRAAHDAAQDAIERARQRAAGWDGNVYRGKDFKQQQQRKLH